MRSHRGFFLPALFIVAAFLAGMALLILWKLPLAACALCSAKGKWVVLQPWDRVLVVGYKENGVLQMRKTEHNPSFSVSCPRCSGKGRLSFYKQWTARPADDSPKVDPRPDGPVTISEEMPD